MSGLFDSNNRDRIVARCWAPAGTLDSTGSGFLKYFEEMSMLDSREGNVKALQTGVAGVGDVIKPYSQSCKFFIRYQ